MFGFGNQNQIIFEMKANEVNFVSHIAPMWSCFILSFMNTTPKSEISFFSFPSV